MSTRARPPLPPQPYLVVGLARSGIAAVRALRRRGLPVIGLDSGDPERVDGLIETAQALRAEGAEVHLGSAGTELLQRVGSVVKSPGVPDEAPVIAAARRQGVTVIGELELAWRLLPNELIAVTGTNGKTTTVELIVHVHREAGMTVALAGNVGLALSALVDRIDRSVPIVCEASSFQLQDTIELVPEVAVLLNLAPDHLDRHGSFDAYATAKLQAFARQRERDVAVLPAGLSIGGAPIEDRIRDLGCKARVLRFGAASDSDARRVAAGGGGPPNSDARGGEDGVGGTPDLDAREDVAGVGGPSNLDAGEDVAGVGGTPDLDARDDRDATPEIDVRDGAIFWRGERLVDVSSLRIKGAHNVQNAMAAAAVCLSRGMAMQLVAEGLASFPGVKHRLEEVRRLNGVLYVNDSKATNVASTLVALAALTGDRGSRRIHLILGGQRKGQDLSPLREPVRESCAAVYLIGDDAPLFADALQDSGVPIHDCGELATAVPLASAEARKARAAAGWIATAKSGRRPAMPGERGAAAEPSREQARGGAESETPADDPATQIVLLSPACASFDQFSSFEARGERFGELVAAL